MSKRYQISNLTRGFLRLMAAVCVVAAMAAAQTAVPQAPPAPQSPSTGTAPQGKSDAQSAQKPKDESAKTAETHITPAEAKQLFSLVDELLKFSSQESGFPIKSEVKRQLTTRADVEHYLTEKFNEDEDAKRMQRSEIVLKKFGLLDRDFNLKPFLLALLKEQIEAYYDPKTKTVNMLDWISVDEQKPVLAHELTHALQDQHLDLDKWSDQTPPDVSLTSSEDSDHLAKDELDTAREAVTEGQATAVMMDDILKPMGKSLIGDPEIVEYIKQQMAGSENSPILARAPLLLSESLLFPYREGLSFEQDVWMDRGQTAAFTGALDRPPSSSWEIMNPREYEQGHVPAIPYLPDIHPLVDSTYRPYDIGQVGQLDVHILTGLFGGDQRGSRPDAGLGWRHLLGRTALERDSSGTGQHQVDLRFSTCPYGKTRRRRKHSSTCIQTNWAANTPASSPTKRLPKLQTTRIKEPWTGLQDSDEGPVVDDIRRGKLVFVSESFDLPLARKLASLHSWCTGQRPASVRLRGQALGASRSTIPGRQSGSEPRDLDSSRGALSVGLRGYQSSG